MPKRVALFEKFYYLALVVGLAQIFLALDQQTAVMIDKGKIDPELALPAVIVVNILSYALYIVLIYLAARKGKNWARLALLVFFVVAVAFVLPGANQLLANPLLGALATLYLALEAVGLFFAFTGELQAWFRRTSKSAV